MRMNDAPVVLITNALHYVGPASVARISRNGARIVAQDEAFSDPSIRQSFDRQGIITCDVTKPEDIIEAALDAYGRIDAVVSNDEAPAIRAPLEDATTADFRSGLEAMMVRPFELARAAIKPMKHQGGGRIILVTSAAPLR